MCQREAPSSIGQRDGVEYIRHELANSCDEWTTYSRVEESQEPILIGVLKRDFDNVLPV